MITSAILELLIYPAIFVLLAYKQEAEDGSPVVNRFEQTQKRLNVAAFSLTNSTVTATLRRAGRVATVVVSIVAWFSISNHCALGAIERPVKAGIPACHQDCAHSTPAKDRKPASEAVCCKLLQATLAKTNHDAGYDASTFVWQQYFLASLFFWDDAQPAALPEELDTGPPFSVSFAESVLQRSILAHAPPALA